MNNLNSRLAQLSPEKQALFRARLDALERSNRAHHVIPRCADSTELQLSFAQERIWLHQQLVPESVTYNRPANFRLRGPLEVESLRRALAQVTARHVSLRTTVGVRQGTPTLHVHPQIPLEMQLTDVSGETAPENQARQLARKAAYCSFDLEKGLLRSQLLRIDREDHLLVLTFSHFTFDAWSQVVLLQELSQNYEANVTGVARLDEPLSIQYTDFAAWDRSSRRDAMFEEGRSYWRRELSNPPVLHLPTDFPRSPAFAETAGHVDIELSRQLVSRLRGLADCEQTTLFSALLAAFAGLLHRYSGDNDIVVGCPVAGRNRVETEPLIGVFINTLPFRTTLAAEDTFRQVLRRVGSAVISGLQYQDVPLQYMVQDTLADRDLSGSPLFQAMFIYERLPIHPRTAASVIFEPQDTPPAATMVDLSLELMESPGQIRGRFVYRSELWEHGTIERMTGHFVTLLEGFVNDPDQRLSELPLLTERERHQLVVEWNDTARDYPSDKCVHELFEEQVERTPTAVAVVFQDEQLTYRVVNERANQLAHYLRSAGVGPQTLVGLCLERSPDLIVAILGILKAGGAYVPLDADYPRERIQFMLADARIAVLVTQEKMIDRIPATNCQVVCLDTQADQLHAMSSANPITKCDAKDAAYVMFTSGSTGRPKGVVASHRSVANLVFGNEYAKFGQDRIFLQLAPVSFDASTFEIWGAMLHGAKLVIAPSGLPDFETLEETIRCHRVTTLWLTAALFNQIVDHYPQALQGIEEILTGGEVLSVTHIHKAQTILGPAVQLINGYGPTESTTFTACYRIPHGTGFECESIPIGRPIANTQVYVLDRYRQLTPIGVPGELYIGGAGLARGYLNRPELTAEKFVANPFASNRDSRLYRTGDICRWRADGNLEFLGRIDNQVKLRGFRIELGEIETALNEHPSVAQCVVMLREDSSGEKRLVAYCVPTADATLNFPEIRCVLQRRLPDYMLPTAFVVMEGLPLTSSGKVNRRDLPIPDESRPELESGFVAPRNPSEQQLAAIWCDILKLKRVGIHDNFFALGGHSLLAVKLVNRINQISENQLKVSVVFESPTIAELADRLRATVSFKVPACHREGHFLKILREGSEDGTVVIVGAGIAQLIGKLPENVTVFQLGLDGIHSQPYRGLDIAGTAAAYADELLAASPSESLTLIGFSYGGLLAYALAQCLRERGRTGFNLMLIEPTTVSKGPGINSASPIRRRTRDRIQAAFHDPRKLIHHINWHVAQIHRALKSAIWRGLVRWRVNFGHTVSGDQLWDYYVKLYRHHIDAYQPVRKLSGRVHLECGHEYLKNHQRLWVGELLAEEPFVHDHGPVNHLDLVRIDTVSGSWLHRLRKAFQFQRLSVTPPISGGKYPPDNRRTPVKAQ
jgi:amino acid adenylation domain-containing protein